MVGSDAVALGVMVGNDRLEASLFGNRRRFCRMRSRQRRLQHRDIAAVLTFLLQRRQLAALEFFLERCERRLAVPVGRGTPGRLLDALARRLLANVEQQRLETVRMLRERNRLNEHAARRVIAEEKIAFEGCGAFRPASRREFLPLSALARDEAVAQVGVQDRWPRTASQQAERGIVAGEQPAVQAHPY